MTDPPQTGRTAAGDIGRRVSRRRRELGLSRAQVAERAGVASGYLAYIEDQPATPSPGTISRLAEALQTTPRQLLGAMLEVAPGGAAGRQLPLRTLDRAESLQLLGASGIGRVALWTDTGPIVVPVNYVVIEDDVVFRTALDTAVAGSVLSGDTGEVAFEVDRIDDALQQGWSVLVVGPPRELTDPHLLEVLHRDLQPWAAGSREVFIAVRMDRVTGRRLRAG
jgi:transcriptional regulator with XRE-family HTH domain